jgi:hypothetical protein
VKILFDANTPAPLSRFLRGHQVVRADELGWQGLENGALLDAAEQAGFDLPLTCDQNVRSGRTGVLGLSRWRSRHGPRRPSIFGFPRWGRFPGFLVLNFRAPYQPSFTKVSPLFH